MTRPREILFHTKKDGRQAVSLCKKPTIGMMFMAMALPKVMKLRVSLRIVF